MIAGGMLHLAHTDALFHVGTYGVHADDLWVVATALACGLSSAILGCFLVLRRMSLLGDAISHAILPGLALAFILTKSRDAMPMLAGAMVVGLLTAALSSGLHRWGRVQEDSAMGVVFSTLFALGVLLISWVASDVDLDPGCVLYGVIETSTFDTVRLWASSAGGGVEMPRAFVRLAVMLAINLSVVLVFWKELKIVAFDAGLARAMGISAGLVHYGLMTLVAGTTVMSFEAVGSILVIAMLVAPAATAQLLTDRLGRMVAIACGTAFVAAVGGYALAVWWRAPVAGTIAVVSGVLFVLAVFGAPRYGVISKVVHRGALSLRIAREDVLGAMYRAREASGPVRSRPERHGAGLRWLATLTLRRGGALRRGGDGSLVLTEKGLERGRRLVRAHRLWETYLAQNVPLPTDHLHEPAERVEHFIGEGLDRALGEETRGAIRDPMGKDIPPRE